MKRRVYFFRAGLLRALALLLTAIELPAQLVNDGATNTLANVTNSFAGDVTVGTNGSFTLLTLSDNALLINSLRGVIGRNATAQANEVRLISPTARWQPGTTLYIGSNGPFNRLVISNGAQVVGNSLGNAGIMGQNSSSFSNLALVTGAGSVWSNRGALKIGFSGARNQLVVSNGARVHSVDQCYVGLLASSTNNRVMVTGGGSLWSSDAGINFGLNGTGNRLSVLAGGGVLDDVGEIGGLGGFNVVDVTGPGTFWTNTGTFQVGSGSAVNQLTVSDGAVITAGIYGSVGGSSSSASLNTATVTDLGSMWLIDGDLYVGRDGPLNRLFVSNGGLVAATNLFVGFQPTATSNRVTVNGGTLRVTNAVGTGVLDVRRGTNQLVSGLVEADRLLVTNGTSRFEMLGGTLVTRGAILTTLNNGSGMDVGQSGGGSAFWDVRPGLLNHFVANSLYIGNASTSNQLLVSSGARLTNGSVGYVGSGIGADGNSATVTGPGSRWDMGNELRVGERGAFNRLTVADSGRVASGAGRLGMIGTTGNNNLALVTGAGSTWSNTFHLFVGEAGSGNQLQVDDGGLVVSDSGTVGLFATSSGNTATVTGSSSEWRVANTLEVGDSGSFNRLLVNDGATVRNQNLHLGVTAASSNNIVIVTGSGSLLNNHQNVIVGFSGPGNQLLITNGASVVAAVDGFLGHDPGANNNVALVTGTGSMWTIGDGLLVGYQEDGNQLVVSNGGVVANRIGHLGYFSIANNNVAVVTGAGSVWSNRLSLNVGFDGAGNRLVVSNGATVAVGANAVLGAANTASSNAVLVTGSGSACLVSSNLVVGSNGAFNVLRISDGGRVANDQGFIGANSIRNTVWIADTNSVWTNRSTLTLGNVRSQNQLVISNGAGVHSAGTRIGHGEYNEGGASGNSVLVYGAGSYWSNSGSIYIGYDGDFNRLTVTNGGRVVSTSGGEIGYNSGLGNPTSVVYDNSAIVSGPGSLWSMGGGLNLGRNGRSNRLQVDNGGKVISAGGQIGDLDGFVNSVTVSGPDSVWSNTGPLTVGEDQSERNTLAVSNGALVSASSLSIRGSSSGTGNKVVVDNATLRVTNGLGTGFLRVQYGSNVFNSGLIDVDRLDLTSPNGAFYFNRGTLITGGGTIDNGSPFIISAANSLPRIWQIRPGGGDLSVRGGVIIGTNSGFANNLVQLNGGTLRVTNVSASSTFDLRRGTNQLTSGVMEVDGLLMTNTAGILEFNGGTLRTRSTTCNNGRVVVVGNGINTAALELLGGTHSFANNLVVAGNAALGGNGAVNGNVTNFGAINPGLSAGSLRVNGNLKLQNSSVLAFELGGLVPTNHHDQLTVTNFTELAGTLSLSLINAFYPAPTNSITLMKFASFSGQFANVPLAGARLNTTDNRASFFVSYTPSSVMIGGAQYADSDGDGMSDLKELLAGTDPNDPNSVLKFTSIARDPLGRYAIQFQSVEGKSYWVEYANALTNWQTVNGAFFTQPASNHLQWIDDGSLTGGLPPRRAYRIRLQ